MVFKPLSEKSRKKFLRKLGSLCGQDVQLCFQCGTCTGICHMIEGMQHHPRKIIRFAQLGDEESLKTSNTSLVCATCYACNVSCPRSIDIPRIMEAIRLLTLRKNLNFIEPSKIPKEAIKDFPQIALVAGFRKLTS